MFSTQNLCNTHRRMFPQRVWFFVFPFFLFSQSKIGFGFPKEDLIDNQLTFSKRTDIARSLSSCLDASRCRRLSPYRNQQAHQHLPYLEEPLYLTAAPEVIIILRRMVSIG